MGSQFNPLLTAGRICMWTSMCSWTVTGDETAAYILLLHTDCPAFWELVCTAQARPHLKLEIHINISFSATVYVLQLFFKSHDPLLMDMKIISWTGKTKKLRKVASAVSWVKAWLITWADLGIVKRVWRIMAFAPNWQTHPGWLLWQQWNTFEHLAYSPLGLQDY